MYIIPFCDVIVLWYSVSTTYYRSRWGAIGSVWCIVMDNVSWHWWTAMISPIKRFNVILRLIFRVWTGSPMISIDWEWYQIVYRIHIPTEWERYRFHNPTNREHHQTDWEHIQNNLRGESSGVHHCKSDSHRLAHRYSHLSRWLHTLWWYAMVLTLVMDRVFLRRCRGNHGKGPVHRDCPHWPLTDLPQFQTIKIGHTQAASLSLDQWLFNNVLHGRTWFFRMDCRMHVILGNISREDSDVIQYFYCTDWGECGWFGILGCILRNIHSTWPIEYTFCDIICSRDGAFC